MSLKNIYYEIQVLNNLKNHFIKMTEIILKSKTKDYKKMDDNKIFNNV